MLSTIKKKLRNFFWAVEAIFKKIFILFQKNNIPNGKRTSIKIRTNQQYHILTTSSCLLRRFSINRIKNIYKFWKCSSKGMWFIETLKDIQFPSYYFQRALKFAFFRFLKRQKYKFFFHCQPWSSLTKFDSYHGNDIHLVRQQSFSSKDSSPKVRRQSIPTNCPHPVLSSSPFIKSFFSNLVLVIIVKWYL